MIHSPYKSLQKFVFKYFLLMSPSENSLHLKVCPSTSCFRVNWGDCYESREQDATQPKSYWFEGRNGDGNDGSLWSPLSKSESRTILCASFSLTAHIPTAIRSKPCPMQNMSQPFYHCLASLPNMSPGFILALCPLILHTASRTIFLKHKCDYLTRHLLC